MKILRFRGADFILGVLTSAFLVLGVMVFMAIAKTENLLTTYEDVRADEQIYISPGPYGGVYQVNERYQDVKFFAKWVVNQLHMYQIEGLRKQYLQVQPFMSPELLVFADNHYSRILQRNGGVSSHVLIKEGNVEVDEVPAAERYRRGKKDYFVIVYADVQEIENGQLRKPLPLQITIRLKPVSITNSNPYGFIILDMEEKQKARTEQPV